MAYPEGDFEGVGLRNHPSPTRGRHAIGPALHTLLPSANHHHNLMPMLAPSFVAIRRVANRRPSCRVHCLATRYAPSAILPLCCTPLPTTSLHDGTRKAVHCVKFLVWRVTAAVTDLGRAFEMAPDVERCYSTLARKSILAYTVRTSICFAIHPIVFSGTSEESREITLQISVSYDDSGFTSRS